LSLWLHHKIDPQKKNIGSLVVYCNKPACPSGFFIGKISPSFDLEKKKVQPIQRLIFHGTTNGPILPDLEPPKKIQIAKFSYDKFQ
jgi:hypothetical protein